MEAMHKQVYMVQVALGETAGLDNIQDNFYRGYIKGVLDMTDVDLETTND